ncbi:tyrosine phosphatase family protein [Methylovirgula sp. 4M-Z18]|uniref:tyrosine phosphatase family protein n=1 Tax=Methylovirgula sp. 4M-Z18 TaxID=2293567 RepID=UPI000E2FACB9|nr:protein tyrosine phosphatase [Methylovirgula sp. 4M-Z18]RFB80109.1 protein tyrosine phosphatase [Methylovirgula sp. 4M-Z18]
MSIIHVCPLSKIGMIAPAVGARSLVTFLNVGTPVTRPACIAPERHLIVGLSDIVAPLDGHVLPHDGHVRQFLHFMEAWDGADPVLIHCYAGVSRSTAAAFIAACALRPDQSEQDYALRVRALSPTATPNLRLVAIADDLLGRNGRMVDAVKAIGRGVECFEGVPFGLEIGPGKEKPARLS